MKSITQCLLAWFYSKSIWASEHKVQSRIYIALLIFINFLLACFYFLTLYFADITIPSMVQYFAIASFVFLCIIYPSKKLNKGFFRKNYLRQKLCDFSLSLVGILLMTIALQKLVLKDSVYLDSMSQSESYIKTYKASSIISLVGIGNTNPKISKKQMVKFIKKNRKELRKQLKVLKAHFHETGDKKKKKTVAFLLILLSLGIAILAGIFVTAFSCQLSCSGSPAAGSFAIFSGFSLITIGLIFAIRRILIDQEIIDKKEVPKAVENK